MDAFSVVVECAKREGIPVTHIGPALGFNRAYVSAGVNRGGAPRADTLARMLDVCGYELCAVPKSRIDAEMIPIDASRPRDVVLAKIG